MTGEEGMISKEGVVIKKCSPKGKVKVGSEIWSALSIDGTEINENDQVKIKDIEGLRLIVERISGI